MDAFSDGLGFQPRIGEPESSAGPRAEPVGGPLAFLAPNIPDTSAPGPTALQEPAAWTYDFNPASGSSRAFFNGEVSANSISSPAAGVTSWNGETGVVVMQLADVTAVGGAPIASPIFTGNPAAPTRLPGDSSGGLATTAFVQQAITNNSAVQSFNGRTGAVVLNAGDITNAGGAPIVSPAFTGVPTAPTAAQGDASSQVATDAFVSNAIAGGTVTTWNGRRGAVSLTLSDVQSVGGAPIASPSFTGTPVVPTAAPGTANGQAASTAFVENAITAGTAGVASWNTRTGAVALTLADVTGVGGAPLLSPALTGTPTAPTPTAGDSTTKIATTAYVETAIGSLPAGVSTFNGRTGTVTLALADVTSVGGAPLASPTFTGSPLSTTPTPGDNSTRIASTAFVAAAIGALPAQPAPSTVNPLVNGSAAPGTSAAYSRGDHVHPSDTSKLSLTGGTLTGTLIAPTLQATNNLIAANEVHIQATPALDAITTFFNSTPSRVGFVGWNHLDAFNSIILQNDVGGSTLQIRGSAAQLVFNGTAYNPGGGPWLASSDARIKTVQSEYTEGLDAILALRPVVYTYKGNDTASDGTSIHSHVAADQTPFVGLVAQEAETVLPGIVKQNEGYIDGVKVDDLRSIDGNELTYALINAVKTLAARVEALEAGA